MRAPRGRLRRYESERTRSCIGTLRQRAAAASRAFSNIVEIDGLGEEPLVPRVPLQAPLAVQDDAFFDDHVSVALSPIVIDAGLIEKVEVVTPVT